jgi:hypothetical protein
VSRTKDAVYRQSGEADYDEVGSPLPPPPHQAENEPDAVVTPLDTHREL